MKMIMGLLTHALPRKYHNIELCRAWEGRYREIHPRMFNKKFSKSTVGFITEQILQNFDSFQFVPHLSIVPQDMFFLLVLYLFLLPAQEKGEGCCISGVVCMGGDKETPKHTPAHPHRVVH